MFVNYLNLFLCIFGIVVTVAAIFGPGLVIAHLRYESLYMRLILAVNLLYLISVGVEALVVGKPGFLIYVTMNVMNFMQYFLLYLLSAMVTFYMGHNIRNSGQIEFDIRPFLSIYLVPFVVLLSNLFTRIYFYIDESNLYVRGPYFIVSQVLGILCQLVCLLIYVRYRNVLSKNDRFILLPFTFVPVIGALCQIFSRGINLMVIATTACSLFMTMVGMIFWNTQYFMRENELEQLNVAMRIGTFWPDFIYTTLADISALCEKDPDRASFVIDHFADYLRKSMNDLSEVTLHPFEEEMKHLENYLLLEQIRFGEKLDVIYDIETTSFDIPTQVLQQTSECMIRYVQPMAKDVFCLTVHTEEMDDGRVLVEFFDDAYEEEYVPRKQDEEELQALSDINERLKMIPGSHLDYESSEELGTMIKIYLFQKD